MAPKATTSLNVASTASEMESMAKDLNPLVKFWDPLGMIKSDFAAGYGSCSTPTVGWLREAEIKHGRVAMAAFVGYCVQANHIFFPVHVAGDFSNLTPEQQWDAVPLGGKLQIIGLVGILEAWRESNGQHYMNGGEPGKFPDFNPTGTNGGKPGDAIVPTPHPLPLNLWDPFGTMKNRSPERKAKSLLAEINNGRLAMLGMMGFVAASKFDGSVPALDFIPHYDGNIWAPLQGASGDFGVWSAGKGAVFSFANGVTTVGDLGIPGITPQ
jgi:hypothetical protein